MKNTKNTGLYWILINAVIVTACNFIFALLFGNNIWIRCVIFFAIWIIFFTISGIFRFLGPAKYVYRMRDWNDESEYYHPPYDNTKWNVSLDTHTHTKASDGRLSVEKVVKYHQSVGFNACFITDHNTLKQKAEVARIKEKYKDEFVLIQGMEYTTLRIHMCFLGIHEWDTKSIPLLPTNKQLREAINKVHDMGGLVVVCHYPWSTWGLHPRMPDHPTREEMYEWGVDLIECANWDDDISNVDYTSHKFAIDPEHPNMSPCCGTDMHEPFRDPLCGWTLLNVKEFSEKGIMEELRNHRTDVLLDPKGKRYQIKHRESIGYKILRPFMVTGPTVEKFYLGGRFTNIDAGAVNSIFIYLYILFIIFEVIKFI